MTAPLHPREMLSACRDGELDRQQQAAVAAHLRGCASCRRELEQLARVDALLAAESRGPADVPDGYFEALPRRIAARLVRAPARPPVATPARRAPRALPAWAYAAAAALLMAVAAPFLVRGLRPVASPERLADQAQAPAQAPAAALSAAPQATPRPAHEPGLARRRARADQRETERLEPPRSALADAPAPLREAPGFAAAPPPAPAQSQAADAVASMAAANDQLAASAEEKAEGRATDTAARPKAAMAQQAGGFSLRKAQPYKVAEARFAALAQRTAASADEMRALRADWRSFLTDNGASPHAGEAWVQVAELSVRLAAASGDDSDRTQARLDAARARAFLARDPVRFKDLLERLPAVPDRND
jgi:hypothetical protein